MRKIRVSYRNGQFTVIDAETKQKIEDILEVGFEHHNGGVPTCVLKMRVEIEDYVMEMNLNENTK